MNYYNTLYNNIMFACLTAGSILCVICTDGFYAIIVSLFFFFLGWLLIKFIFNASILECRAFSFAFVISWFWASISAYYITFFNDQLQLTSDPSIFFNLSTNNTNGTTIDDLKLIVNSPGAVFIWRIAYSFFSDLGFPKEMYIGIYVNILCVSLTLVLAMKMVKLIFGNDVVRLRKLIIMYVCCGNVWLMASLHMRDAFVLITLTTFIYICLLVLLKPSLSRILILGIGAFLFAFALGLLRKELFFAPLGIVLAGFLSYVLTSKKEKNLFLIYLIAGIGLLIVLLALFYKDVESIINLLMYNSDLYKELTELEADSNSLGVMFIFSHGFFMKTILGSIYLYVFPIPFWSGFQLDSSYYLFKSFNVIFMYFMLPLAFLAINRIVKYKKVRSKSILFMLFITLEFTLGVAASSCETRHLMVFIVPFLILCLLPDLSLVSEKSAYKRILLCFLFGVGIVHLSWAILKFL